VRDIHDHGPAGKLFQRGEAAFHRGHWREALRCFTAVVGAVPGNLKVRLRIADALLNAGHRALAVDVYGTLADHAMNAGHPLMGLVATKMLLLLDPDAEERIAGLAALYARDSERVDALWEGPAAVLVGDEPAQLPADDDALETTAAARALAVEGTLPWPRHLPAIPLLSHLDEDAFQGIAARLRLRRFADGEVIIRQGERGESFFLLADGEVWVKRDVDDDDGGVTLARLRRGSVFGELALISDEPRHASVVAHGDVDVLELRCSDLIVASATMDGVSRALKLFTRERFLRNLTATHPFFAPLSRPDRHRVMDRFDVLTFASGESMIVEGQRGPGLFLILSGSAAVEKTNDATAKQASSRVHLASLRAADLCGEMSMLSDAPTNATITCTGPVEALFLGRDAFKEVVAAYPELLRYLATLTDERLRANRALLHGHGLLEDDEHVML
jgi:cAMP-dependent protein kinase regulator